MSGVDAYMVALERGLDAAALDAAQQAVLRDEGPLALARCLELRLDRARKDPGVDEDILRLRAQLAEACS